MGRHVLGHPRLAKDPPRVSRGSPVPRYWSRLGHDLQGPSSVSEAVWIAGAESHASRGHVHALGTTEVSLLALLWSRVHVAIGKPVLSTQHSAPCPLEAVSPVSLQPGVSC